MNFTIGAGDLSLEHGAAGPECPIALKRIMEISHDDRETHGQDASTGVPMKESWFNGRAMWLIVAALVMAIVGVAFFLLRSGGDAHGDRAVSNAASDHSPGSEVLLYLEGRTSVMVATDEAALDELIRAISSRDGALDTLLQSGRVFNVPNKTRVRIIEANFSKLKVRIIEGPKIMSEVWAPERWVR